MRRALTATLTALTLTAGGALTVTSAVAQSRWTPVATFTLDANGTTLPAVQVAADWSKGTNVLVRTGTCTGAHCIKLTEPAALSHCLEYTGTVLGCAGFTLPDGSCGVEVNALLQGFPEARRYATAHEVGHCFGLGHLAVSRALMYPTSSLHPRIVAPTRLDKAALNAIYPRT